VFQVGDSVALRAAFGPSLLPLAEQDSRVMVVTADLGGSVGIGPFAEAFPDRYINCGVAETSMIGISAGLASEGQLPYAVTFGSFVGRTVDHVRQSIGHNRLKVNIVGSHGGISNGMDGPSAHAIEDVGIMRSMPGMTIVAPSCPNQLPKALRAAGAWDGPVYLRLYREPLPVFTSPEEDFEIGRAIRRRDGADVTVLSYGPHVGFCLQWAEQLAELASIEVIEVHTIEPLDRDLILESIRKTGRLVTIEDHYRHGGLGSAAAELIATQRVGVPFRPVALAGYARSGPYDELRDAVGIGLDGFSRAVRGVLGR
jgi:transketolase